MPRDDSPDTIPSFAASRDEAVSSAPRGAVPSRSGRAVPVAGGGMGIFSRLILTLALVVAAVACAWAFQLQTALEKAGNEANAVSARVADLEALLSDTDESVEKSAAALGAQLKVVDTETRRLEQRRREMDNEIDKLKKASAAQQTALGKLETTTGSQGKTVAALSGDLASLKKVAGDFERLSKTAKDAQVNMERLADNVNKANLERAAINKRVTANEEWIDSINAFRKQVNANISRLESEIRASGGGTAQPMQ